MIGGDDEAQPASKMRALGNQGFEAYGMKSSDEVSAFIIAKDPLYHQDRSQPVVGLFLSCMCGPARRALFSICFVPLGFLDGFFSKAYEWVVMSAFLTAEFKDRSRPLPIYSATVLCCTSQTEVAKGYR
jgi:hypothetical protein